MREIIKYKMKTLSKIKELNLDRYNGNKFNICIDTLNNKSNDNNTFLDGLYLYMNNKNIGNVLIKEEIEKEEFDSDGIKEDIFQNENGNN